MKKLFHLLLLTSVALFSFTACGSGGGDTTTGGNIDNVVVDPRAYYIDAVEGNDANDGKTPQTAWKTLAKLNSVTINAGNKLLFRTGQRWYGQLEIKNSGTTENPIVIGSYGDGEQPVLSALGTVYIKENNNDSTPELNEWIPYNQVSGGISDTYKEPVPDPDNTWIAMILSSHPYRIRINGEEILGAFDSTELSDTFKWWYNKDKPGIVFYYYGNDKPSEIETNLYTSPLYIHDCQNIRIENVTLEGGYVAGLFIENASNILINQITTGNMSKQGIYVKALNTVADNIKITNSIIDSRYTLDYSMAQPNYAINGRTTTSRGAPDGIFFLGGVQNSEISRNTIKNWTHANINMSAVNGEYLINNKVFENSSSAPDIAYGGRIAIDGKNAYNNAFYNNTIYNIRTPIQLNGHDNSFHDNTVYNISSSVLKPVETGYGIVLQAYVSPVYNNTITNNRFTNIEKDAIHIIQPDVGNIIIEGNAIE